MVARDFGPVPSHAVQGGDPASRGDQKAEYAQGGTERPPSFLTLFLGWNLEETATYCASDQQDKAKKWIVEHWCSVKRTDVASAGSAPITGPLVAREDADAAASGERGLFVFGRLIYRDPFGRRGETGFSFLSGRDGQGIALPFKAHNYRKTYEPDDQTAPHAGYEM